MKYLRVTMADGIIFEKRLGQVWLPRYAEYAEHALRDDRSAGALGDEELADDLLGLLDLEIIDK